MSERSTRVLLIEDNPGDADLIRLRLVEGSSPVDVSCAQRLSDGLASISEMRNAAIGSAARPEPPRQPGSGDVPQSSGKGSGRTCSHSFRTG